MRKITIGSGLTILAATAPVQALEIPTVVAPAGVTETGAVRLSEPGQDDTQPVIDKDKPSGVIGPEFKLSNDVVAKPATATTQTKQVAGKSRSKGRVRNSNSIFKF